MNIDFNGIRNLLQRVGQYQMSRLRSSPAGAGSEKLEREFVSEVDVQSEEMLIQGLNQLLPEAGVYGEESGRHGNQDLVWIIDPLDGTTNFLSGLDQFSISVALVREGVPELGAVYRPASNELFFADINQQHFEHQGKAVSTVVPAITLSSALLGTGFPYRSPDQADAFFSAAQEILYQSRGIRRFGSAALDLSYVACGYLQGFWETDLQPYDVAAALVFLNIRGLPVTNLQGKPFNMFEDRMLIAGMPQVHENLLEILNRHYDLD